MNTIEVKVPAIGDFKDVGIIDVLVKPGEPVQVDSSLVTLESDKATMDVPSPQAGNVRELRVKVGDRVKEGSVLLLLDVEQAPSASAVQRAAMATAPTPAMPEQPVAAQPAVTPALPGEAVSTVAGAIPAGTAMPAAASQPLRVHASPAVRMVARELGVDLSRVTGSGPRGRILREDVQQFVKQVMSGAAVAEAAGRGGGIGAGTGADGAGLDLLPWPRIDFAKFGPVESRPLSRVRRIAGANLARNWVMIPHVTQYEEADVTALEAFRQELNRESEQSGVKVTLLAFLVKACVAALQRYPEFNSSLDGDALVLKRYFHVGFAADTPNGLVVPVIRDADRKGLLAIARELGELAAKARDGKLALADMQGGTFSISSLGGVGGTAFTPIINAPEVAILGASRTATKPVWDGAQFTPRLMLPLSLSYDHRVIDGVAGARFIGYLAKVLADMRRAML